MTSRNKQYEDIAANTRLVALSCYNGKPAYEADPETIGLGNYTRLPENHFDNMAKRSERSKEEMFAITRFQTTVCDPALVHVENFEQKEQVQAQMRNANLIAERSENPLWKNKL